MHLFGLNLFFKNFKEIYPKELDLKIEHYGSHATFLDLDIHIKNFDKKGA